jgi:hypothetical protein
MAGKADLVDKIAELTGIPKSAKATRLPCPTSGHFR